MALFSFLFWEPLFQTGSSAYQTRNRAKRYFTCSIIFRHKHPYRGVELKLLFDVYTAVGNYLLAVGQ